MPAVAPPRRSSSKHYSKLGRATLREISLRAHTDATVTGTDLRAFTQTRANALADELVKRGLPRALMKPVGVGDAQPLVAGTKGNTEPQNRRVEVVLR